MTYEDFVERPEWPYPAPALAIIVLQPPSPTDASPTPLIAPNTASSLPADYSYRTKPSMYVDHDVVHVFLATTDSEFSMDNKKILSHFSSSFWTGDSIPYEYADYVRELRKRQDKVVELPPDNQVAPRPYMQKDNGIPLIEFKSLQKAKSQLMLMLEWKELTVRSEEEREKEQWWKDVRNGKDRQSSRFSMWLRHELAGPRQLYGAEDFVSTNRLVRSQSAPSATK
ncbi:hypothetical protein BC829DRAFT_282073 [Chytridium lagenaria]|nr:hypothetical protein BC829DRAFT_282073 [Chytridium lagenaria]